MTIFYKRSGQEVSRAKVRANKLEAADNYEFARPPIQHKNPRLAERLRSMSEEEYCRYSGNFTYKVKQSRKGVGRR